MAALYCPARWFFPDETPQLANGYNLARRCHLLFIPPGKGREERVAIHRDPLASRRFAMNDQERYLFDLNGNLVVPDALSHEQVATLNGVLDEHRVPASSARTNQERPRTPSGNASTSGAVS